MVLLFSLPVKNNTKEERNAFFYSCRVSRRGKLVSGRAPSGPWRNLTTPSITHRVGVVISPPPPRRSNTADYYSLIFHIEKATI